MSVLKQALQHKGNDAHSAGGNIEWIRIKNELSMDELEAVNGGWDFGSLWEGFKDWFCGDSKKEEKKDEPGGCELTGGDLWK